jgi:transcriptional regulator with XRE-family HTH domain
MELGEKIRLLRKQRGMKQQDVARASGITQATISRIETGHVKQLKSDALRRLAEAFDTTSDYLLEQENSINLVRTDPNAISISKLYGRLSSNHKEALLNMAQLFARQDSEGGIAHTIHQQPLPSSAKGSLRRGK